MTLCSGWACLLRPRTTSSSVSHPLQHLIHILHYTYPLDRRAVPKLTHSLVPYTNLKPPTHSPVPITHILNHLPTHLCPMHITNHLPTHLSLTPYTSTCSVRSPVWKFNLGIDNPSSRRIVIHTIQTFQTNCQTSWIQFLPTRQIVKTISVSNFSV